MQHTCSLGFITSVRPLHRPVHRPSERVQLHVGGRRCPAKCAASSNGISAPSFSAESLRTPHSGYHWDGIRDQFFEGWYWKVRDFAYSLCTTESFALCNHAEIHSLCCLTAIRRKNCATLDSSGTLNPCVSGKHVAMPHLQGHFERSHKVLLADRLTWARMARASPSYTPSRTRKAHQPGEEWAPR